MSGRHSRDPGMKCHCSNTQFTHTCPLLDGKPNHYYDEDAVELPDRLVKSVDEPPPPVGD